jgi:hypothetical protein
LPIFCQFFGENIFKIITSVPSFGKHGNVKYCRFSKLYVNWNFIGKEPFKCTYFFLQQSNKTEASSTICCSLHEIFIRALCLFLFRHEREKRSFGTNKEISSFAFKFNDVVGNLSGLRETSKYGRTTQSVGRHNLLDDTICRTTQSVRQHNLSDDTICRTTQSVGQQFCIVRPNFAQNLCFVWTPH